MNTLRTIIVTLTLAAIAASGSALARDKSDRERTHRDGTRIEQRAESRRESRRENRRWDNGDDYTRVDRRQERQRYRIKQGRRSGELTRGESRRLKKQQKRIARMEDRFYADDYLSGRERRRLAHAQDRASRRIARFKHNDIYRGSGNRYAYAYGHDRGDSGHGRRWSW